MEGPPGDLKHLFIEWLQEAAINATKKGTKAAILYNKALGSVGITRYLLMIQKR